MSNREEIAQQPRKYCYSCSYWFRYEEDKEQEADEQMNKHIKTECSKENINNV